MTKLLHYEKPVTSSRRGMIRIKKNNLWKGSSEKQLTKSIKNTGGRNNQGVITCKGRINTKRRKYRIIDFERKNNKSGKVLRLEYDPNRSAHIALVEYSDRKKSYILATENMTTGMTVCEGDKGDRLEGHCLKLMDIDVGSKIHNIEFQPGKGGQLVRSAGAFATLISKQEGYAEIKLPSKETRRFPLECKATIGIVSNIIRYNRKLGKAGMGLYNTHRRPKVRGVVKNPVDHANGGKTSGGKVFSNFNGNVIKGKKTRKKNKFSNTFIVKKRSRSK